MRIGIGLDPSLGCSFDELRALGALAGEHGYESIWTTAGSVPDPFHLCAAWALGAHDVTGTEVRTGIGVLPAPRAWPPHVLAAQAATVGVIAHGQFVLGIGSGGGADADYLAALGFAGRPLAVMRAYVAALRALLAGDEVGAEIEGLRVAPGRLSGDLVPVPVYLSALGPQMLRLAGMVADGVSLSWATPAHIAWSEERLQEGLARAGRSREEVELSGYVRVCVDDDVHAARSALVGQFLRYGLSAPGRGPLGVYRAHFARMGFEEALTDLERRRAAGATASDLVEHVPDELAASIGYFGDGRDAPQRVAQLATGLDEAIVRVVAARPGPASVTRALEALAPIRAAPG